MRLIDARFAQHIANVELSPDAAGTVQWVLSHTPTIDAVPVSATLVRCEKCVLHGNCVTEDTFVLTGIENPFCCAGKRKESAE